MRVWLREPIQVGELADETGDDPRIDWRPDLDIYETAAEYLLVLCVPGVAAEDLEVSVLGQVLTIAGRRVVEIPEHARPMLLESPRGRFLRRIRLPGGCHVDDIGTRLAEGQLVVRVPRRHAAPLRIPITTAEGGR
ncbi:MAG TPA: Hsp20/alpha crystallin family protein [Candidatus Dormibacteraeota bacterium]|nr:Hsp20/alpha crystallin family protein [Candidatus Dormibacteraeota bacterium]